MFRFIRDSIQPDQLVLYLDDHVDDDSAEGKLHALVLCVRRQYKGRGGYTKEEIAQRSRLSVERVTQVLKGRFFGPPSRVTLDVIVDFLMALDATPTELEVAVRLYDQMARQHKVAAHADWPTRRPARSPAPAPPLPNLEARHGPDARNLPQPAPSAPPGPASPPEPQSPPARPAPRHQAHKANEGGGVNPMVANDVAEFVAAMKAFRASKGRKSFRRMERECTRLDRELTGRGLEPIVYRTYSTYQAIGNNGKLPSLENVRAYIVGAGGDLNELATWEQEWTRLAPRFLSD